MISRIFKIPLLIAYVCLWPCIVQAENGYALDYHLDLTAAPKEAKVSLTVRQDRRQLRRMRFLATSDRFINFNSTEGLVRDGDYYVWHVPKEGGVLNWHAPITHRRSGESVDAKLGKQWALFRGEDAFPAMTSVAIKGSASTARFFVDVPAAWTFITALAKDSGGYRIDNPARRFDRPTGWMIAGKIGLRFDKIAGVNISIAAPMGDDVRRQDLLALLNWTLPALTGLFPSFPPKVLVVSAGDPFWRGGLSGPASLYLHADRPLISENGTSTLLHEMFHVGFTRRAEKGNDWIVEGLAEYYSVELLVRTGTVTKSRHSKTLRSLAKWAKKSKSLNKEHSSGATTARAVGIFAALDKDIRQRTSNKKCLDHVVRKLATDKEPLNLTRLREIAHAVSGGPSDVLAKLK